MARNGVVIRVSFDAAQLARDAKGRWLASEQRAVVAANKLIVERVREYLTGIVQDQANYVRVLNGWARTGRLARAVSSPDAYRSDNSGITIGVIDFLDAQIENNGYSYWRRIEEGANIAGGTIQGGWYDSEGNRRNGLEGGTSDRFFMGGWGGHYTIRRDIKPHHFFQRAAEFLDGTDVVPQAYAEAFSTIPDPFNPGRTLSFTEAFVKRFNMPPAATGF